MFTVTLLTAACVSNVVDDDGGDIVEPGIPRTSVVVPIVGGAATRNPLQEFYDGVYLRLNEAHQEQDLALMQALLANYEREDVSEAIAQRLAGFRALAMGLEFELHAVAQARLRAAVPAGEDPVDDGQEPAASEEIGKVSHYELVLPPLAGVAVKLGGGSVDDPIAFGVDVRIRDYYLDGSSRTHEDGDVVLLSETVLLQNQPLRLPLELDLGPSAAVKRELDLRIDLLPGYLGIADRRVPVRRTTLAARSDTQWPQGLLGVRDKPLQVLRDAMAIGDASRFMHVRLAAEFASADKQQEVRRALIDWVRLGRPDQAMVAMAALAATTDVAIPVGDRDGWLAWWQASR